jgi:hypothetical protein
MGYGTATAADTRNTLVLHWENGWAKGEYEVEGVYSRYINRFFSVFGGGHFTEKETVAIIGFDTLLPLLLKGRAWVTSHGVLRIGLERELQMTDRLSLWGEIRFDSEESWKGAVALRWRLSRLFSLEARYDSKYGTGAGLRLEY